MNRDLLQPFDNDSLPQQQTLTSEMICMHYSALVIVTVLTARFICVRKAQNTLHFQCFHRTRHISRHHDAQTDDETMKVIRVYYEPPKYLLNRCSDPLFTFLFLLSCNAYLSSILTKSTSVLNSRQL